MLVHSICKTEITLSFPIFHLMPKIWHGTEVLLLPCNNNVIHKKFKRSSSPIMQMLRNSFLIIIWCQIIIKWRRNSLSLSNCWGRYSKSRGKKSNWQFRAWKTLAPNVKFHLQSREVTAFSPSRNWRLYNLRFLCKLKKKKVQLEKARWFNVITLPALSKCNSPSLTQRRKKQGKKPNNVNFAGCTNCLHIVTLLACGGIPVSTTYP